MQEPEDLEEKTYRDWLQERRGIGAPAGFSDRVLRELTRDQPAPAPAPHPVALWARAAIITLAALFSVGRYAIVLFSLFLG